MKTKVETFFHNFLKRFESTNIVKLNNCLILSFSYYLGDFTHDGWENSTLKEVGRESETDLSIETGLISEGSMSLKR